MASKAICLLTIVASIARANAMAIDKLPENSSIAHNREITSEVSRPEVSDTAGTVTVAVDEEDRVEIEKSALVKRSIKEDDVKIMSNNDIDDLETAAGTNILRPLFVYRQQLAYRQRVRKAGRRAAPNF